MLHFFSSKRIVVVAVTPGMVKVFKSALCFIQPLGELLNSVYFCHKSRQKRLAPGRFSPFFETKLTLYIVKLEKKAIFYGTTARTRMQPWIRKCWLCNTFRYITRCDQLLWPCCWCLYIAPRAHCSRSTPDYFTLIGAKPHLATCNSNEIARTLNRSCYPHIGCGGLSWCLSSKPSLSVGFSIQDEAMGVVRSTPIGG